MRLSLRSGLANLRASPVRKSSALALGVSLVLGCSGTPKRVIAPPPQIEVAVANVIADMHISAEEWRRSMGPIAALAPLRASATARRLLAVLADSSFTLAKSTEVGMRAWLGDCGYIVAGAREQISVSKTIARNPTETDWHFRRLWKQVKALGSVRLAVLEAGALPTHSALETHVLKAATWDFTLHKPTLLADSHGTAVASVAVAGGGPIELLLTGSGRGGDISTWTDAIDHVARLGARVINISYDFYGTTSELEGAILEHSNLWY